MRRDSLLSRPGSCPANGVHLTLQHVAFGLYASAQSRLFGDRQTRQDTLKPALRCD